MHRINAHHSKLYSDINQQTDLSTEERQLQQFLVDKTYRQDTKEG